MKSLALGVWLLLVTSTAAAGNNSGKVTSVTLSTKSDIIYFKLDSENFISCATSKRYAISTATDRGLRFVSLLLSAKAAEQTIDVISDNVCTVNADSEDVWFIIVN